MKLQARLQKLEASLAPDSLPPVIMTEHEDREAAWARAWPDRPYPGEDGVFWIELVAASRRTLADD